MMMIIHLALLLPAEWRRKRNLFLPGPFARAFANHPFQVNADEIDFGRVAAATANPATTVQYVGRHTTRCPATHTHTHPLRFLHVYPI